MNDTKWIRCADRLPTKDGKYLTTYRCLYFEDLTTQKISYRYYTSILEFLDGKWRVRKRDIDTLPFSTGTITAWMELPKPYKEEE